MTLIKECKVVAIIIAICGIVYGVYSYPLDAPTTISLVVTYAALQWFREMVHQEEQDKLKTITKNLLKRNAMLKEHLDAKLDAQMSSGLN